MPRALPLPLLGIEFSRTEAWDQAKQGPGTFTVTVLSSYRYSFLQIFTPHPGFQLPNISSHFQSRHFLISRFPHFVATLPTVICAIWVEHIPNLKQPLCCLPHLSCGTRGGTLGLSISQEIIPLNLVQQFPPIDPLQRGLGGSSRGQFLDRVCNIYLADLLADPEAGI